MTSWAITRSQHVLKFLILFQGVKESAVEDCNQAIELKDNYVKALLRRGQCLEDLDKPHEALKDFEKVLEIDPGLAEAKTALMVIFYIRKLVCMSLGRFH